MKTKTDKRMARVLFAVAAAAAFFMAFGARTAQAAPIAVKSVNYNLTSEEPLVDPEKTENDVKVKITGLLTTDTEGVKIDTSNEFLEYWDRTYKQLNGVGAGSDMVFPLKQYYFCAGTELKPGYDWVDEVKALPHMKETPVTQLKTFQVFVNGEVCDKAIICYNSVYNLIRVSFPIGNDLSKAKGELTENTFTYDGKVKDPEVKSLTLGTLEPDEDEYRLDFNVMGESYVICQYSDTVSEAFVQGLAKLIQEEKAAEKNGYHVENKEDFDGWWLSAEYESGEELRLQASGRPALAPSASVPSSSISIRRSASPQTEERCPRLQRVCRGSTKRLRDSLKAVSSRESRSGEAGASGRAPRISRRCSR